MRASILTYHSGNMAGNDYSSNNLLALAHDLDVVRALRLLVVPLPLVVDCWTEPCHCRKGWWLRLAIA
ncbi:MAG TPA: hypothetical protein VGA51_01120 [Casimicrobiaceae bacterium]